MGEERMTIEIVAPTIEEAIARGLEDLGVTEEEVDVEVMDSGTRGFLGLGSRQARVRLSLKSYAGSLDEAYAQKNEVEDYTGLVDEKQPVLVEQGDEDDTLRVARETVEDLLERMKVPARVTTRYGESDDENDAPPVLVEIHGDDLSILIGRRSETLNALQYIATLIVGKQLAKWISLQIDVEGYRARREHSLRQIARRMAEQTVVTGKRQVLEPMPANERRIIHLELRNHPKVITESTGEDPNRKVTIALKQ